MIQAQEAPQDVYFSMWCIKAKTPDARPLIKEVMKPFEESLIKEGISMNWFLMRVEFPNGENCNCDYYGIQVFNDHRLMEFFSNQNTMMAHFVKHFPDKNPEEVMKQFKAAIESGPTQIYKMEDTAMPAPVKSQFATVNFMNVKEENTWEYMKMESEIFKPLHQAAAKKGMMLDWVLMSRVLPRGAAFDGNFITVDVNGSMENVMKGGDMEKLWKEVHPDKDMEETMKKMMALRTVHRSELWQTDMSAEVKEMAKSEEVKSKGK
jgi:hypothetical protein